MLNLLIFQFKLSINKTTFQCKRIDNTILEIQVSDNEYLKILFCYFYSKNLITIEYLIQLN